MAFEGTPAGAYERFMGRFSTPLSAPFADHALAGVGPDPQLLDVGCGPGMLTAELVRRTDEGRIAAVDPASSFVSATAERFPRADVREASAEALPFADDTFDAALAQLVVHFMSDPVGGVREMARVTRPGGAVAVSSWDNAGGRSPLTVFAETARRIDPAGIGERAEQYDAERVRDVVVAAGLRDVSVQALPVSVPFQRFEDWWEPFTEGVGPAGDFVAGLSAETYEELVAALRGRLGDGPFEIEGRAWSAVGLV